MQEIRKIDIGCGKNKRAGFTGIDNDPGCHPDIIASALELPLEEGSIDEVYSAHLGEHFEPSELALFFDEIYRVLKTGGTANLKIDKDWTRGRLMRKDPTHKYRFSKIEIEAMLGKFSSFKVDDRRYLLNWHTFRNKLFVYLKK